MLTVQAALRAETFLRNGHVKRKGVLYDNDKEDMQGSGQSELWVGNMHLANFLSRDF